MKAEEFKKNHNWELIYDVGEIEMFDDYANQRVIEELEKLTKATYDDGNGNEWVYLSELKEIINQLKTKICARKHQSVKQV